jgi:predicted dehydrogenase
MMKEVRWITLAPGHFHAALVHKEMYAGVAKQAHVYAPLDADLIAHLNRILAFNTRKERPTEWQLDVHVGPDFLERLLRERPGNVVILSGRNHCKIDYILAAVQAGLHVLADKPWIITTADLPKLQAALDQADAKGLVAYDIMTERYEITSLLQRELVQDSATLGTILAGSESEPGVFMESKHYLLKTVAGTPLRRPTWFFDVHQQGEGLTDVGTHLVDLVPWILFPGQPLAYPTDLRVLSAKHWPTVLSKNDFQRVTGAAEFPSSLASHLQQNRLDYYCNTRVGYTVRGVHVTLNVLWDLEAGEGMGDTHLAIFRGSRARVEVRQGAEQNYRSELYVVPNQPAERAAVLDAVQRKMAALQTRWPGVAVEERDDELCVTIPQAYRVGHEAHFAQVAEQFLKYLQDPSALPTWEKPNMLAKYYVTTAGVAACQPHQ